MTKTNESEALTRPKGGDIIGSWIVCAKQDSCRKATRDSGQKSVCTGGCDADPKDPCVCRMFRKQRKQGSKWEHVPDGHKPAGVSEESGYDYICLCVRPK